MNDDIGLKNKFFDFMSKLGDLIFLNVLFIIFCIPIFTIGASISALLLSIKKVLANEESYVYKDFISEFSNNFKSSTSIFVVLCLIFIPFFIISSYFANNLNNIFIIMFYIIAIIALTFSFIFVFPLQITFENTTLHYIKNSFLTSLKHLPFTIILIISVFSPLTITWLIPQYFFYTFGYWVMIGFSLQALCTIAITNIVFKEYLA